MGKYHVRSPNTLCHIRTTSCSKPSRNEDVRQFEWIENREYFWAICLVLSLLEMLLFPSKICKHVSWLEGKQCALNTQTTSLWREGAALWKTSHVFQERSLKHLGSQREKYFTCWRAHGAHWTHVHTYSKIPYVLASKQTVILIIICQKQYIL